MTLVKIDIKKVAEGLARPIPDPAARARMVAGLGAAALAYWKKTAQQELRSTSRDYAAGLVMQQTPRGVSITLEGTVPNMVENGWPGGDMRAWMLQSPKARTSADGGKYLAVPFRHGTPGTGGRNVGGAMPASIHAAAKQLAPTLTKPGGGTQWGGRLGPASKGVGAAAAKILGTKAKPWHTASVYTGMVRREKTYQAATQNSYGTFRTISTKSRDPRSWYHPGVAPRRLAAKVQTHLGKLVVAMMKQEQR